MKFETIYSFNACKHNGTFCHLHTLITQFAAYVKEVTVQHGSPTFLWKMAIPVIEGWFAGRQSKKKSDIRTRPPKLLCEVYSIYTI